MMKDKIIKYSYILAILGYILTISCYIAGFLNEQDMFGFNSLFIGGILLGISSIFMLIASVSKLSKYKKNKQ